MRKIDHARPRAPGRLKHTARSASGRTRRPVEGVDYIGMGVGAMVFDSASRIFLAKRGPAARNERHHWEFPGGAVQLHERLSDAIKREFVEEFGMHIEPDGLLCIADHVLPADNQHWVSACFIARHISGEPKIREHDKCLELTWAKLGDLPSPLTIISASFLRAYNDAIGAGKSRGSDHALVPWTRRLPAYMRASERGK